MYYSDRNMFEGHSIVLSGLSMLKWLDKNILLIKGVLNRMKGDSYGRFSL